MCRASKNAVLIVLGAGLAACATQRPSTAAAQATRPHRVTSAELVAAGERDTVYVRRVRMFEEIAATIRTDSLARIFTAAMNAPAEKGAMYQTAIACQFMLMIYQYGGVASKWAITRMEDSLFAAPGSRERWIAAQKRWPAVVTGPRYETCDPRGLPHAPDSLEYYPQKTVWP